MVCLSTRLEIIVQVCWNQFSGYGGGGELCPRLSIAVIMWEVML